MKWEWLVEGLFFDVQQNDLWLQSWGAKPPTAEAQEARVRELVNAAPKLVPIIGHCYLLAEPCEAGNPVLSIYQSDIILYGITLYDYFLAEFGGLAGGSNSCDVQLTQEKFEVYQRMVASRMAAIASGAFVISSNRVDEHLFGGRGLVIGPNGEVLASTSRQAPFVTIDIDRTKSIQAKQTYPRNVRE